MEIFDESVNNLSGKAARLFAEGIVETIHEPLMVLNTDLMVIFVNKSFYSFFKSDPNNTLGTIIYDLGNRQWDNPALKNLLEEVLPETSIIKEFEITHSFPIIGKKTLILNISKLDIETYGQMILISINDITEFKRLEDYNKVMLEKEQENTEVLKITNEELMVSQDELNEMVNRLEISNKELDQFAYIASHDLQEPLRMVSSFTQLLEKRYKNKLDSDADEFIKFIIEGSHRMKDLIDDLLAFSRLNKEPGEFKLISMQLILFDVLENLQTFIKENKAQITHDTLPTIYGNSSQISQLFQNLITNAIKFQGDDSPKIHISVQEFLNYWKFGVSDNGIGIAVEHQEKIFEAFKRLHNRTEFEGNDIGLAISAKIVERHGGKIWVESEPRTGSTFYFTISK